MLNRRVTRTVLNSTEKTYETKGILGDPLAFNLLTSDRFYVGFHGKFASRYFQMGTANATASVVSVKYWNGSGFVAVDDLVDQTRGFTQSGFISWENATDWKAYALTPITDEELYWVEISVSVGLDAGTTLQSVLNLYSDDNFLRVYYPELVTDSRFKPLDSSGNTVSHFLEQHQAAKDEVVLKLKQRKLIQDESQVIDINDVSVAAVHACAALILRPIARSEEMKDLLARADASFQREIQALTLAVDQDKDGVVSERERNSINSVTLIQRRG